MILRSSLCHQGVSKEGKKFCNFHELGNRMQVEWSAPPIGLKHDVKDYTSTGKRINVNRE